MKKSIQILLLCFLVLIFLCIVFGDYLLPLIPRDVRTSKVPPISPKVEDIPQSSTHVHPVVPQPSVSATKPCFLTLNGTPVFGEGSRAQEIRKNIQIGIRLIDPDDEFAWNIWFDVEKKIIWCPLRSSWGPSYQFSGIWECVDGDLFIRRWK